MISLRRTLTMTALLLIAGCAMAQDTIPDYAEPEKPKKERRPFKDRLYFGGGLGLTFGTVTYIQVEPLVGVELDDEGKLSTGVGVTYSYYQDNRFDPSITFNDYGYRTFLRYRFIPQLFAHAEFLHLNVERYFDPFSDEKVRLWVPHVLVGGGYVQALGGGGSSIYIQALWEVLQDPNSVYLNQGPILSVGIGIGF